MTNEFHRSVLLKEVIDLLQIKKGKKYIDATLGGGGHTKKILELGGLVLGIDADQDAIDHVQNTIQDQNLTQVLGNFKDIANIADLHGFSKVAGIIYDLGISSRQIEDANRGFSFQKEGPLDMRMDTNVSVTASDLANLLTEKELYEIFTKFGEEHRAMAISAALVRARRIKAIRTTGDLLKIIEGVYGVKGEVSNKFRGEMGKRVFQAFRIAVNSELENLKESLYKGIELLETRGRLVVISFHSLEDRIVKESFLDFQKKNLGRVITKKIILPSIREMEINPRSRSAKLRVFEKIIN
ncbi:MAG: 16S rRNA (cytosine(1402)-N(4))-methyltransferase RsmH [Patescibacteria group bacterium]